MSFSEIKFLGSTVRRLQSSISWGAGQPSQLQIGLVDDTADGDVFSPPSVGMPVSFQMGSFFFRGLFQHYETSRDTSGFPVYDVVVTDPREILEGTKVILGGYSGGVGTTKNLLNVFGYWEAQAFGLSYSNEAGIPYKQVRDGVLNLVNSPASTYGGPMQLRGYSYGLDLRELPTPPAYYRLPGTSMSLLEIISLICEDGAYDFFIDLVGQTIRVRTTSRRTQPALGTISNLIEAGAYAGAYTRSQAGVEFRNEVTSTFLVGGDVTLMNETTSIRSFWGYDILGVPIYGDPGYYFYYAKQLVENPTFPDGPTPVLSKDEPALDWTYQGDWAWTRVSNETHEKVLLNASGISDILGSVYYECSTLEMRFALAGMEPWLAYMQQVRNDMASLMGLTSLIRHARVAGESFATDFKDDGADKATRVSLIALLGDSYAKQVRAYEFVLATAREYYGKRFAVDLPFLAYRADLETLKIFKSYEIADAGYMEDDTTGTTPLSVPSIFADTFRVPDGRFKAMVKYNDITATDLSTVNPQGSITYQGAHWMECQVNPLIYLTPTPICIITLGSVLFEETSDVLGDSTIIKATLQLPPGEASKIFQKAGFGTVGTKISPKAIYPDRTAIPLKSNTSTYGPWYANGAHGKVNYEKDDSLTPWNYGSTALMDLAGYARVLLGISQQQESEAGSIEIPGLPPYSLGDLLDGSGPNITSIDCRFGVEGVTTSMRLATFTKRFGIFSRGEQERLKRLATSSRELRKQTRNLLRQRLVAEKAVTESQGREHPFFGRAPKWVKKETPHEGLIASCEMNNGIARQGISSLTYEEAIAFSNASESGEYQKTVVSSWNAILTPYGASGNDNIANVMTLLEMPSHSGGQGAHSLNPFGDENNIEFYTWGEEYEGLHAVRRGGRPDQARSFALRGPLMVAGFGRDLNDNAVPAGTGVDGYVDDYRKRADLHPVGPVDLLWDDWRKVWTAHDCVRGMISPTGTVPATGSTSFEIYFSGSGTGRTLEVDNITGSAWESGVQYGAAVYDMHSNRWNFLSAEMASSSSNGIQVTHILNPSYPLGEINDVKNITLLPEFGIGATSGYYNGLERVILYSPPAGAEDPMGGAQVNYYGAVCESGQVWKGRKSFLDVLAVSGIDFTDPANMDVPFSSAANGLRMEYGFINSPTDSLGVRDWINIRYFENPSGVDANASTGYCSFHIGNNDGLLGDYSRIRLSVEDNGPSDMDIYGKTGVDIYSEVNSRSHVICSYHGEYENSIGMRAMESWSTYTEPHFFIINSGVGYVGETANVNGLQFKGGIYIGGSGEALTTSGLTGTYSYLSSVYCSGSSLYATYRWKTYVDGLLVAESG